MAGVPCVYVCSVRVCMCVYVVRVCVSVSFAAVFAATASLSLTQWFLGGVL